MSANPTEMVKSIVGEVLDVKRVVDQTIAIQHCMKAVMTEGVHYGIIPGTEKPTLYQPGADKLCMLFRLRPKYFVKTIEAPDFISVVSRCRLIHIPTEEVWGEGMGSANSREEKYVNQSMARLCPKCKKPTIFRSKNSDGKGWFCWAKKGGCGAQFNGGDPEIEGQGTLILGDKVWNLHNTILKVSNKRSKAAAVLTTTAASDIFGQDLEDLEDVATGMDENAAGQHGGKPNGNGATTNGNGKKATPMQVRDLNVALNEMKIPAERRIEWVNEMLGLELGAMTDLHPEDADMLIIKAKAGEVPGGGRR